MASILNALIFVDEAVLSQYVQIFFMLKSLHVLGSWEWAV